MQATDRVSPTRQLLIALKAIVDSRFTGGIDEIVSLPQLDERGYITFRFRDGKELYDCEISPDDQISYVESKLRTDSYLLGRNLPDIANYIPVGAYTEGVIDGQVKLDKAPGKVKKCPNSKPCGNTCIAKGLRCTSDLGPREKQAMSKVRENVSERQQPDNTGLLIAAGIGAAALGAGGLAAMAYSQPNGAASGTGTNGTGRPSSPRSRFVPPPVPPSSPSSPPSSLSPAKPSLPSSPSSPPPAPPTASPPLNPLPKNTPVMPGMTPIGFRKKAKPPTPQPQPPNPKTAAAEKAFAARKLKPTPPPAKPSLSSELPEDIDQAQMGHEFAISRGYQNPPAPFAGEDAQIEARSPKRSLTPKNPQLRGIFNKAKRERTELQKAEEKRQLGKKLQETGLTEADKIRGKDYELNAEDKARAIGSRMPVKKQTGLVTTKGTQGQPQTKAYNQAYQEAKERAQQLKKKGQIQETQVAETAPKGLKSADPDDQIANPGRRQLLKKVASRFVGENPQETIDKVSKIVKKGQVKDPLLKIKGQLEELAGNDSPDTTEEVRRMMGQPITRRGMGRATQRATKNVAENAMERTALGKVRKSMQQILKKRSLDTNDPRSLASTYQRAERELSQYFEKQGVDYKKLSKRQLFNHVYEITKPSVDATLNEAADKVRTGKDIWETWKTFTGNPEVDAGLDNAGISNKNMRKIIHFLTLFGEG